MVDTLVSGTRIPKGCASSSLVPGKSESFNKSYAELVHNFYF